MRDRWADLDIVAAMELPAWLDGDELPERNPSGGAGTWVDMRGRPYSGSYYEQKVMYVLDRRPGVGRFRSRPFFRGGDRCLVSTGFLGLDHSFGLAAVPLLWETMVFVDSTGLRDRGMWRYATRAAALNGHRQVIAAIREMQQWRRERRLIFR